MDIGDIVRVKREYSRTREVYKITDKRKTANGFVEVKIMGKDGEENQVFFNYTLFKVIRPRKIRMWEE